MSDFSFTGYPNIREIGTLSPFNPPKTSYFRHFPCSFEKLVLSAENAPAKVPDILYLQAFLPLLMNVQRSVPVHRPFPEQL